MKLKLKFVILTVLLIAYGTFFFTACKVSAPKIVGCNQVKYKGETWTLNECSGATSGTVIITTSKDGKTVTFTITCANGCIDTVTAD
jgi:hypothetical protein